MAFPSLTIACLARNEAGFLLPSLLEAWNGFAGTVCILDDNSEDDTAGVAERADARVRTRTDGGPAWGNESGPRAELYDFALSHADPEGWILWLDADMVPLRDPRPLLSETADAVAFVLYDLWSDSPYQYRSDVFWQGHNIHRLWAVRTDSLPKEPEWSERGLHCGHLPSNYKPKRIISAPKDYGLLHFGYAGEARRREKLERYRSTYGMLTPREIMHAETICDPEPNLIKLKHKPQWPIDTKTVTTG